MSLEYRSHSLSSIVESKAAKISLWQRGLLFEVRHYHLMPKIKKILYTELFQIFDVFAIKSKRLHS